MTVHDYIQLYSTFIDSNVWPTCDRDYVTEKQSIEYLLEFMMNRRITRGSILTVFVIAVVIWSLVLSIIGESISYNNVPPMWFTNYNFSGTFEERNNS